MKRTETINKFKTTLENKKYIKMIKENNEIDVTEASVVAFLLNLGIEQHKKIKSKKQNEK